MSATRPAARLLFAGIVATLSCGIAAPAAEFCRFAGTTDYSGHVAVTTRVTARAGAIQVDVAGTFDSSTMFWFGVHYLVECHLGLGKLYGRTGKRDDAREHLTIVTTMYREMEMDFWLGQAAAAQLQLGQVHDR
jgi:hypothetical protein